MRSVVDNFCSSNIPQCSVAARPHLLDVVAGFAKSSFSRLNGWVCISRLTLLIAFCLTTCCAFSAAAQDSIENAKQALNKKAYPWYDASTDGTRSLELKQRPDPRSANRNDIPLQTKQLKSGKTYNPPAGGGGSGGAWNFGGQLAAGLGAMTWAIIIALMLLLIGILIWAMLRMNSQPALDDHELAPTRSIAESIKQLPFELEVPTGDFRQQAHAAYAAGDYQRAMTYLFSHVLVTLDQKGLVRLRRGKTNREYLRELRSQQPIANYYQHVMVPFEASFFGDHELSKPDFETCWQRLEQFQADVESASHTAVTSQHQPNVRVANA